MFSYTNLASAHDCGIFCVTMLEKIMCQFTFIFGIEKQHELPRATMSLFKTALLTILSCGPTGEMSHMPNISQDITYKLIAINYILHLNYSSYSTAALHPALSIRLQ